MNKYILIRESGITESNEENDGYDVIPLDLSSEYGETEQGKIVKYVLTETLKERYNKAIVLELNEQYQSIVDLRMGFMDMIDVCNRIYTQYPECTIFTTVPLDICLRSKNFTGGNIVLEFMTRLQFKDISGITDNGLDKYVMVYMNNYGGELFLKNTKFE